MRCIDVEMTLKSFISSDMNHCPGQVFIPSSCYLVGTTKCSQKLCFSSVNVGLSLKLRQDEFGIPVSLYSKMFRH